MKNHLIDKLHSKGKTEEDRYFAENERKLIEKLRTRLAPPKIRQQENYRPTLHREEGNAKP